LFWVSRRYPEKKTKSDPLLKAFVIVGGLLLIALIAVGVGYIDKEWLQQNIKWFFIMLVALIAFYMWVAYRVMKPIPFKKRYAITLDDAFEIYRARPYIGMSYFPTLLYHNVFEGELPKELMKDKSATLTGTVDAFLLNLKDFTVFALLVVVNVFSGENVKMVRNPSVSLVQELLGKEAVSVYKEFRQEFEEGEESSEEKKE